MYSHDGDVILRNIFIQIQLISDNCYEKTISALQRNPQTTKYTSSNKRLPPSWLKSHTGNFNHLFWYFCIPPPPSSYLFGYCFLRRRVSDAYYSVTMVTNLQLKSCSLIFVSVGAHLLLTG